MKQFYIYSENFIISVDIDDIIKFNNKCFETKMEKCQQQQVKHGATHLSMLEM